MLWSYIEERIRLEAKYIIETGATVRATANFYGISKSTVHKDVTDRLQTYDAELYEKVRRVLDKNLDERHIRGGLATKNKYAAKAKKG